MFLPDEVVHRLLDAEFAGGPTRWLLLSTTEPALVGGAYTDITEPDAASYARVQVLASEWPTAADRAVELDVVFPDVVDDFGVIAAWGLASASTGGTVDYVGLVADPVDLPAGTSNVLVSCRIEAPDTLNDL